MAEKYLEVAFNIPVPMVYTYKAPEEEGSFTGRRVVAWLGRRKLTGWVVAEKDTPPENFTIRPVERVVDKEPLFHKEYLKLAWWLADYSMCTLGEALSVMLPGGRREKEIPVLGMDEIPEKKEITLSEEQEHAVAAITEVDKGSFYLYGITGSGKTEVFLQAASKTLAEGRSVIYLVPEISLTHQVVDTLTARFSEGVAVLHSHLTPSQKLTEWNRIKSGEARLIIGARSAVFAPALNLGLLIIDEEHETSYKSGSTPRYSARQVAMKRCALSGARLVMGSATPSVESWNLMNEGRIKKLTLSKRLSGGAMPEALIVDMKREENILSKKLTEEIFQTWEQGKQTILFLNRRGFSYFFHCKTCGYEMKCRNCSVSLTYHKHKNTMVCHYCGFQVRPVQICPECSSLDVGYSGFGTEHIEEEVSRIFPQMKVARIDTDTASQKGVLQQTLKEFKAGKIDILLGTQMVARGLNFPGVQLVGIVMADTGLRMPDFRAQERTFALITQVAGRAGRYARDGKVIIQTFMPRSAAVKLASLHKIEEFYMRELDDRKLLGFPPYSRIIRLVFRSKNSASALAAIDGFTEKLEENLGDLGEVLGPSECPLSIIAGNFRYQILIRTNSFSLVHGTVYSLYINWKVQRGVYIEIDVDPVTLL